MVTTQQSAAVVRHLFEEGLNQRNTAVFDEVLAPNYVNYDFPAPTPGPEGFKQVMAMFFHAFPDIHEVSEDVISEGDKVAVRGRFTGTHGGEFMGIPATGKQVRVSYIGMYPVENGQIVENWVQMDLLGMMQQLGVAPRPEQAGG
ncbi:MAG: ester cyclase [Chloroflexi bacterium]|nr:ester cyclase [Chloroflexota bacterium]